METEENGNERWLTHGAEGTSVPYPRRKEERVIITKESRKWNETVSTKKKL